MLAEDVPTETPKRVKLIPNPDALEKLSTFQKAAYIVFVNRLRSLEPLTRVLFGTLGDIKDFAPAIARAAAESRTPSFMIVPDLDRLLGSLRVVLTLWLCYLALIYFNPIPGGANLVAMAKASAMALALMPYLPIRMFIPALRVCILVNRAELIRKAQDSRSMATRVPDQTLPTK